MFAVVDVETTGGYAEQHRVIEVGIVLFDGRDIVQRYNQFIHPERAIPGHITRLTGISDEDVRDAPTFPEVAEEVYTLLQGCVFVAHNVQFDYSFIRRELDQAGYTLRAPKLCTVRLTRKIVPGLSSYSLGKLARHFSIVNPNPHRALADAETAAEILRILMERDASGEIERLVNPRSGENKLPIHLDGRVFHDLPEKPGVYYLLDSTSRPLYIGKAINIKQRIAQHFTTEVSSKRTQRWLREVHNIRISVTGSEWAAFLHEDHEIRHYRPTYNKAQKQSIARWGVMSYCDRQGRGRLSIQRIGKRVSALRQFYSHHTAAEWLIAEVHTRELNPALCGLPELEHENNPEKHEQAFAELLNDLHREEEGSGAFILPGREPGEFGFVKVLNGRYAGLGFAPTGTPIAELEAHLIHSHDSPTTQHILERLRKEETLTFKSVDSSTAKR